MTGETVWIETRDGWRLRAEKFSQTGEGPCLILFPAMGARARIYRRMARHLARYGMSVWTVDPRGVGASEPLPGPQVDYDMDAHLDRDWPAVLSRVREEEADRPLLLGGHSLGGMLSALYASLHPGEVDGLVLLTTTRPDFRNWGIPGSAFVLGLFALFCLVAELRGFLPGERFAWGAPIARGVVRDWARWGVTGRFTSDGHGDLTPALARFGGPVLSVSFTDDQAMGPRRAVDDFCRLFDQATVTRWHLSPREAGCPRAGHFDHLRGAIPFWNRLGRWCREVAS